MSKDTIYRQDAIDEIKEIYEWHDNVTKERIIEHFERLPSAQPKAHVIKLRMDIDKDAFFEAWKAAQKDMTFLPPENDGWIPVTERLPEDTQNIIVTRSDDGTTDFGQYNAKKNWCVNDSYWPNAFDFVAWMPLPEPYTEESHD